MPAEPPRRRAGPREPPVPGDERLPMAAAHRQAAPLAFWPAARQGRGTGAPQDGGASADAAVRGQAPQQAPQQTPSALVLPALGVPAGAYRRLAEALAAGGTPTGVAEWRGGGASPVRAARGIDWGYGELLQHEVLGGVAAMRVREPARPVALIGHSLGGHLALMARALATPGLAGVLAIASGTPTLRHFAPRLRLQIRVLLSAHRIGGPLLGYFPGHRLGFGGRQARTLMDEWGQLARSGRFEARGHPRLEPRSEAARRIPVHALSLAHDTYAPHAATAHLLELAGVGETHIERFAGPGPLGHFDWLKEPLALAQRMHAILAPWGAPGRRAQAV